MANDFASERASNRVATPLTAAVRIAVIALASMIDRSWPCDASKSRTAPWCEPYRVPWVTGEDGKTFNPTARDSAQDELGIMPRARTFSGSP